MSSMFPFGLIAVVTACPTVKPGSDDNPGFNAWNDDPGAAAGVMCTPVGMKVPPSPALAGLTAPIMIAIEIASESAEMHAHGRRVRPFRNMCYLLFALR